MFKLNVPAHLRGLFKQDVFKEVMCLSGQVFRDVPGRKTIKVNLGSHYYFVKQHFGIGWSEVFKSLFSLKLPIVGAMTEVHAIQRLVEIGIPTTPLVAYGQQGLNPATMQSFVMTEDLGDISSLEDICANWNTVPPEDELKRKLIKAVANMAAKMHHAGLCHRDFYLCHIAFQNDSLSQKEIKLYLVDLHRMLLNQSPTGDAVMKDIAGLYFSAMDCGLTHKDFLLFKLHYLPQNDKFWKQVEKRAKSLYKKYHSKKFQEKLSEERSKMN